jgi:hypothetical protein
MGDFDMSWFCGPEIGFPACESSYEKTILESKDEIERQYAVPNNLCTAPSNDDDEDSSSASRKSGFLGLAGFLGVAGLVMF